MLPEHVRGTGAISQRNVKKRWSSLTLSIDRFGGVARQITPKAVSIEVLRCLHALGRVRLVGQADPVSQVIRPAGVRNLHRKGSHEPLATAIHSCPSVLYYRCCEFRLSFRIRSHLKSGVL